VFSETAVPVKSSVPLADIEIHLLLEGVYRASGCDFREYTPAVLRRRIADQVRMEQVGTVSGLQEKALHDPFCMKRLIHGLSVVPSTLFREPAFFQSFRAQIAPFLRTYPFVRIWNAGCSAGEDAYATAIILHEEGIYHRCKVYATNTSESAISQAREGVFSTAAIDECAAMYARAGGQSSLHEYFTVAGDRAVIAEHLKTNIVFAQHNLATDGSFNDFHVILTRNVLVNFTKALRFRVHNLLFTSLVRCGVLALGERDEIEHTPHERCYQPVDPTQRLYRRVR
jgi:chemotaxis protein methyltransferase CheR